MYNSEVTQAARTQNPYESKQPKWLASNNYRFSPTALPGTSCSNTTYLLSTFRTVPFNMDVRIKALWDETITLRERYYHILGVQLSRNLGEARKKI